MKIIDIEVIELRVPDTRQLDLDPTNNACVIRVHTDAGITGVAEVDSLPSVIKAIVEAPARINTLMGLKAILLGQDPTRISELWQKMYHHTSYCGRRGVVLHAISGIDIALWDLLGKLENKPVAQLLTEQLTRGRAERQSDSLAINGKENSHAENTMSSDSLKHNRLPAYTTVYPLGRTPDELRQAMDKAMQYPVKALKLAIDPFWRDEPELATELLYAARTHAGAELELMLDATATFSDCQQLEPLLPALKECRIQWLEAPFPLDQIDQFAQLKQAGIPIGAGDTGLTAPEEWRPFFTEAQIDIAQPDISWVGGFTGLLQVADMADQAGSRLIPHGWNTDLTLAANLHFLATRSEAEYAEFSTSSSPLRWQLATNNLAIDQDGMIAVPEGPGLGIELNEDIIQRYRVG